MRKKILVLAAIIVVACAAVALASWGAVELIKGDDTRQAGNAANAENTGAARILEDDTTSNSGSNEATSEGKDGATSEGKDGATSSDRKISSGEDAQYDNPNEMYITETQRHQNFFKALGEGTVKRLDVTSTDFQPAGDPNSSYLNTIITLADAGKSDGTFTMKYADGLWRIATVKLSGALAGGTDKKVPTSFGDQLAAEILQNQHFLRKTAEGRLSYLRVDNTQHIGESETVLTGEVGSVGGNTWPTELRMRKDYGLWHMTEIKGL